MQKNKASTKASPKSFRVYCINLLIIAATFPELALLAVIIALLLREVAYGH